MKQILKTLTYPNKKESTAISLKVMGWIAAIGVATALFDAGIKVLVAFFP